MAFRLDLPKFYRSTHISHAVKNEITLGLAAIMMNDYDCAIQRFQKISFKV